MANMIVDYRLGILFLTIEFLSIFFFYIRSPQTVITMHEYLYYCVKFRRFRFKIG